MTREEAKTILRETSVTPYIHPDSIGKYFDAMFMAIEALKQPEIVRCKDCRKCKIKEVGETPRVGSPHMTGYFCYGALRGWRTTPDWFCADGEKKESGS